MSFVGEKIVQSYCKVTDYCTKRQMFLLVLAFLSIV